jgi:flagellar hook-basal body complex protein FliE
MDWQPEGLNNQYLYDTILSSLGFLQLNVAGEPVETARQIPLFAPMQTVPMKVADLANLVEAENPEHVVDLPFAAELWERIFAEMNPPKSILLEIREEPEGDWVRIESSSAQEFLTEVHIHTTQQIDKPTENGEVFEPLVIPFAVSAALDKVVWKGSEYTGRLHAEQEHIKSIKEELEKKLDTLRKKAFEGDADAKKERDECDAELKKSEMHLKAIERILEKLPAAYKEISQNESALFHYSVFLVSGDEKRKLLILTTKP